MKSRNRWYINIVVFLGIIAVLSKGNEAGVCEFCGNFTDLIRHQWRCKARTFTTLTIDNIPRGSDTYSTATIPYSVNNRAIENETSSLVHLNDSDYNDETAPTMSQWLSQSQIITITSVIVENHLKLSGA